VFHENNFPFAKLNEQPTTRLFPNHQVSFKEEISFPNDSVVAIGESQGE